MEGMTARQLEALRRKLAQKWRTKTISGELSDEMEKQLKNKMDEINVAIKSKLEAERLAADPKRIKGVTEHIKDEPMKLKTGAEHVADKEAKLAALRNKRSSTPKLKTKTVAGKGLLGKLGKGLKKGLPALGAIMAGVNILGAPEAQAGEVAMEEATNLLPGGIGKLGSEKGSDEYNVEDSGIDTNTVGMTKELATKVMNKRRDEAREKRRQALEALRKRSGMK